MKGWRLVVAAGLLAGSAMVARPVSASDEYGTGDKYATGDELAASEAAPSEDVWSQVGWGALTGLSNLLYFPAKLVYAGLGGLTGGLALGLTGGDMGTAESIWEPSLKRRLLPHPEHGPGRGAHLVRGCDPRADRRCSAARRPGGQRASTGPEPGQLSRTRAWPPGDRAPPGVLS